MSVSRTSAVDSVRYSVYLLLYLNVTVSTTLCLFAVMSHSSLVSHVMATLLLSAVSIGYLCNDINCVLFICTTVVHNSILTQPNNTFYLSHWDQFRTMSYTFCWFDILLC